MTLREFFRTLLEGYAVVLIVLGSAITVAVVFIVATPATYRASTLVNVETALPDTASAEDLAAAVEYAQYRTITFEALVDTDPILAAVIERLDLDDTPSALADDVMAISALDTNVIEVRVSRQDAEEAALIANAIAEQIVEEFSVENGEVDVELAQVRRAEAADTPVVPNPAATIGLAAFAGLLVSAAWLFVMRHRRTTARDVEA